MAGKIFINYRRGDDPGHTGRLFDRLQDSFEADQLFLDVDNIAPGLDFVRVLDERVAECDIVLAVIGKGWIDARDAAGARRLDDPDDFVRIEIASALNQGKRVVPVLVGDAPMPHPEDLPEVLRPLARRNAVRLTHERFRSDTQGLVKALQQSLEEIETHRQAEAEVLRRVQAEEERKRQEAEAARRAEEEALKKKAEQEAQARAAEERRRQEVAAKQRAEDERLFAIAKRAGTVAALDAFLAAHPGTFFADETQKVKAELLAVEEAQQRAAEERRRQEAAAKQRAEEEREFAPAKRAGTVLALDAFLAVYASGSFADEARKLKAGLLAREEAYRRTSSSNEPTVLRSFLTTYKRGADVDQVRGRLRQLEPQRVWQQPALLFPTALAVLLIAGAGFYWLKLKPSPSSGPQPAVASPPAAQPPVATVPAGPPPDQVAWELLKETTDEAALKRFIAQYPNSPLLKDARARIAALEAEQAAKPVPPSPDEVTWRLLKETTDEAALQRFIAQYPNSPLLKDAKARIAALEAAQAAKPTPPSPDEVTWLLLKDTTDVAALTRFVAQYPNSPLIKDAQARIASLQADTAAKADAAAKTEAALQAQAAQQAKAAAKLDAANKELEAERAKLAAQTATATPTSAPDPVVLTRLLQLELSRVGCFGGAVNGLFDDATKTALENFTKLTSLSIPDDVTLDAIKAVQSVNKRVCPLQCPGGQHADGDRCIANPPPAPKRAESAPERPAPSPKAPTAAPKGNGKCFAFNGRQFCE